MPNHQEHVSLNLNVRGLRRSATIAINELSRELTKQGRSICRLGLGQSPFPVPQLIVEALAAGAGVLSSQLSPRSRRPGGPTREAC